MSVVQLCWQLQTRHIIPWHSLAPIPASSCTIQLLQPAHWNKLPHPIDAASTICRNGTDYEVFTCPRTLLFDRRPHTCNAPEHILRNLSCAGKMGAYPYPVYTSKFIVCHQGSTLVEVYYFSKHLHFYPDTIVCTFQECVKVVGFLLRWIPSWECENRH
jgi:hypothetical protein